MANNIELNVQGLESVLETLKSLPQIAQNKVARAGVNIGGSRLRTMMRRRVPVVDGLLRKSIMMKYIKGDKNNPAVRVGLLTRQYYSTLDVGRKSYSRVYRKGRGGERFNVAGTPRMNSVGTGIKDTWQAHKQEIIDLMVTKMTTQMYVEIGKLAARNINKRSR